MALAKLRRAVIEKNKKMEQNLGSLGNTEIYFLPKYYNEEYLKSLLELLPPVPLNVFMNNWTEGLNSSEVDFDLVLFNATIREEEELVFRYEIGDNKIAITLMQKRIVICIYYRAWCFLEDGLIPIVDYLLNNFEIILIGFELDFNYSAKDLEFSLNYIKDNKSNYPFILKQDGINNIELYFDGDNSTDLDLLSLLKVKVYPIFDMIS